MTLSKFKFFNIFKIMRRKTIDKSPFSKFYFNVKCFLIFFRVRCIFCIYFIFIYKISPFLFIILPHILWIVIYLLIYSYY